MDLRVFQVNAFIDDNLLGNPACVINLDNWLEDDVLLNIAKDNAVPETAFFIKKGKKFDLRWFTPDLEMDLCGHATLATAYTIKTIFNFSCDTFFFNTKSGELKVDYSHDYFYINLPSRIAKPAVLPREIKFALNIQPKYILKSRDYMLIYDNINEIKDIDINREIFDQINLGVGGVIVTAKGQSVDFVSRYFTPQATILEDPVTGSAHCSLVPYWASIFKKKNLVALQISKRGGKLICENHHKRVIIGGKANLHHESTIKL